MFLIADAAAGRSSLRLAGTPRVPRESREMTREQAVRIKRAHEDAVHARGVTRRALRHACQSMATPRADAAGLTMADELRFVRAEVPTCMGRRLPICEYRKRG